MIKRTTIIEIITVLNIILFLYTGIAKIQDYTVFKEQLSESPVLAPISNIIAITLPLVEFAVVVLLVIPRWRLKGLYTAFGLMVLFTGYIIALITTSDHLPCSCGGIMEELSWQQHIIFNGLFIILNALAIRLAVKEKQQLKREWNNTEEYRVSHG